MKSMKILNSTIIFFSTIIVLYYAKFLLLPLFLSIFLYIIINSLSKDLVTFAKKKFFKINEVFSFIIILLSFLVFSYFSLKLLKINLSNVISDSDQYQKNLNDLIYFLQSTFFNFSLNEELFNKINVISLFSNILNFVKSFAGNFSLVLIYLIFIVMEKKFFHLKVNLILKKSNTKRIISKINDDIYSYFRIKTLTSFLTGFLTFVILFIIGNDLSLTFAIFAFFLNFIPYIGSLLAVILPTFFSAIQFMNLSEPLITFTILIFSQICIGNFLETKLMGKTLNISPLALLIFLSLMGKLWGIIGMFLSVPLLVILIIILNNIKETKKIAIFLSEKGID